VKILLVKVSLVEGTGIGDIMDRQDLARRVDKISGAGDMHSDSHRLIRRVKTLREMFYRFLSLRDALTWVRGAYYRGGKGEVK